VPRSAAIRLFRPGPRWYDWWRYYNVVVDRVVVGEIWPRQARVFEVAPGEHQVRLKLPHPFFWGNELTISVDVGQIVELACWPDWTGLLVLRSATPRQSKKMREIIRDVPPPRNLGAGPP